METTGHVGLLTLKDNLGNKQRLYPITKREAVEGLDGVLEIFQSRVNEQLSTQTSTIKANEENIQTLCDQIAYVDANTVSINSSQAPEWIAQANVYGKVIHRMASSRLIEISDETSQTSMLIDSTWRGCMVLVRFDEDVTITIDGNDETLVGCEFEFVRMGTGAVKFVAGEGVTLYSIGGPNTVKSISDQYGVVAIKVLSSSEWLFSGALQYED